MKGHILYFLLILFLVGCDKGSSGIQANSTTGGFEGRGVTRNNAKTPAQQQSIIKPTEAAWGRVSGVDSIEARRNEDKFYGDSEAYFKSVKELTAKQFQEENLNIDDYEIKSDIGSSTSGIAFWGSGFRFADGQPYVAGVNYPEDGRKLDPNTANFRMEIYLENKSDSNDRLLIPIHFKGDDPALGKLADSWIGENFVQLIFADSYGLISLRGAVYKNNNGEGIYAGIVEFKNFGQNEQAIKLGEFVVPACNFFVCQQQQQNGG